MADDKVELIFDPVLGVQSKKKLVKDSEKVGAKSGKEFGDEFGKKSSKAMGSSFKKSFGGLAAKAVAAIGVVVAAFGTKKVVAAAMVQQDAINALNSSLELSKNASITASAGFQVFASELQGVTRFGDEVILQNAALIQSLGDLTSDGLKDATLAATDLATALRVDLGTAATLVGKAAAGEVGSFSRYGLSIKKAGTNAETFKNAMDAIRAKFGGAARKDVHTFSGALEQLTNTFGDLQEELGKSITQSPQLIKLFKGLSKGINQIITDLSKMNDTAAINGMIQAFLLFVTIINNTVYPAVVGIKRVFILVSKSVAVMVQAVIGGLSQIALGAANIIEYFGGEGKATTAIKAFSEKSKEAFRSLVSSTGDSFKTMLDPVPLRERINTIVTDIKTSLATVDEQIAATEESSSETVSNKFSTLTSKMKGVGKELKSFGKEFTVTSKQIAKAAITGLGGGVSSGFAAMGAALVKGENALEAFGKAFMAAIGQQLVTLGTRFILEGIATSFSIAMGGPAVGGPLIAAGAAMSVAGGAMGAMGGGKAGGAAAGGGGGVGAQSAVAADSEFEDAVSREPEERETQTGVNINIAGDYLDSDEGALKIVGAVNRAFETQGAVIRTQTA